MTESSEEDRPLVLVVEDDEPLARLRARSLEQMGLHVIVGNTLDEARSILDLDPALDAVLVDIKLSDEPGDKGGIELAKEVRERYGDIPVFGYSAFYADEIRDDIAPLFDRYYAKAGSGGVTGLKEALLEIGQLAWKVRQSRDR